MRSALVAQENGSQARQDVHKADIVALTLNEEQTRLLSVCRRGILAEWDLKSLELKDINQLKIEEHKVKSAVFTQSSLVAYMGISKHFRVFDLATKSL